MGTKWPSASTVWSDSFLRWNDHIKRDPDGPDCLKAVHGGRLYDTHLVSSYDFREAARSFVVFVDTKVNAWGFLICGRSPLTFETYLGQRPGRRP